MFKPKKYELTGMTLEEINEETMLAKEERSKREIAKLIYAVIGTNNLVSALFTHNMDGSCKE
jgi:hypothetical protein